LYSEGEGVAETAGIQLATITKNGLKVISNLNPFCPINVEPNQEVEEHPSL